MFDNIKLVSDEGCRRPCKIDLNPSWFNSGQGKCYKKDSFSEEEVLKDYFEATKAYVLPLIKQRKNIKEKLLNGEEVRGWTIKDCDREIAEREKQIKDAENNKKCKQYGAYNSVAIFFSSRPTENQIEIMKRRAQNFAAAKREIEKHYIWKSFELTIEGFRLVKKTSIEESEDL